MRVDPIIHDFKKDLQWSEQPARYVSYLQAVTHWWPTASDWDRIRDIEEQKQGKDINLTLPDGTPVKLQCKKRRKDYGDFLIEYRHDYPSGFQKPGWIEVPSDADFLLYFVPNKVYRLDYKLLHQAWTEYGDEWKKKYDRKPAENPGYKTRNVSVPFLTLKIAHVDIDHFEIFDPVETALTEPPKPLVEQVAEEIKRDAQWINGELF